MLSNKVLGWYKTILMILLLIQIIIFTGRFMEGDTLLVALSLLKNILIIIALYAFNMAQKNIDYKRNRLIIIGILSWFLLALISGMCLVLQLW